GCWRLGGIYCVEDPASAIGWSVVEIEGENAKRRAAFVPGQLEAVPMTEIKGRILGPVPAG
ncbi:MAG: hypothetical protein JRH16_16265, partial [Deltaproteobacteria bacterium]|nr:hypothetical protein [Deltaproteobacteria bacterium]